jgi:hypothetical protein
VDHFSLIFISPSSVAIPNNARFIFSEFLNFSSIYDYDLKQAVRRLSSWKCVGPDKIPSFIIEGCSEMFVPFLSHIFNISSLQGKFPTL